MGNLNVPDLSLRSDQPSSAWPRLRALGSRIGEARGLGADVPSQLGYLATHYWGRLASHAPFELPRFELPITVRAQDRALRVHVRSNAADWGILRSVFLEHEYALSPRPSNVTRIVDLGANCGFASLYFAACFPDAEILALEPMPGNARACRRHFAINRVRGAVIEAACARDDGFAELLLADHDGCHGLVPLHDWKEKLRVETLSIPTLLTRQGWTGIDILKVDIEGYEKLLFEGSPGWLESVRLIIGELHGDYGQHELQRDIGRFGFAVRTLAVGYETTFVATRDGA
jgi:FkbM family methyltransferase